MLSTTVSIARAFGVTPFEIMAQECDEVIMLLNYYIEKADDEPEQPRAIHPANKGGQKKIKVNNATATGGWW